MSGQRQTVGVRKSSFFVCLENGNMRDRQIDRLWAGRRQIGRRQIARQPLDRQPLANWQTAHGQMTDCTQVGPDGRLLGEVAGFTRFMAFKVANSLSCCKKCKINGFY